MSPVITRAFPLTSAQREIWFDQMLHPDIPLYNIGGYVHIPGKLNTALFGQAVNLLVQKHDTLRTVLRETTDEDGVPLQAFVENLQVQVPVHNVSAETAPQAVALAWMQARLEEPFALTQQAMFRCDLVRLADDDYYCLLQYHHLINDGWGLALVVRSLADIYSALVSGIAPVLVSPSYTEFVDNDRRYVESSAFQRDRDYWLAQYPSAPERLLTPLNTVRPNPQGVNASECQALIMSRTVYQQLERLAQQCGATVFHVLLGALYVYFARTSQQTTFAVGLPVLNRANAKFKQTLGLFVGVSPVLLRSDVNGSFVELVQTINTTLKAVYRHQRFPVSEISRLVHTRPDAGSLFDINFSFQKLDYEVRFAGIPAQNTLLWSRWEQSPLVVHVQDFQGHANIKLDFVYNLAYFQTADIASLQTRFITLLEAVLGQASLSLQQLPLMPEQEQRQLQQWSGASARVAPSDGLITQLVEAQVVATPDAIAVACAAQHLTYRELNTRANQVAHYLRGQGIGAEMPVGLSMQRSVDMLVGLLGILKAGGVYLPLDPDYPAERISFMLAQTQAKVVLTQQNIAEALRQQPTHNPNVSIHAAHLAYLIYTSGSTGQPKGVMVEHGGLVSHTLTMRQHYALTAQDRVLQFASMSFDVALEQILPALISGAQVVIGQADWSLDVFSQQMQAHGVSVCDLPPAYLQQVLEHWEAGQWQAVPSSLRLLIVGNDVVPPETVALWRKLGREWRSGIRLLNAYGPTEATITATCHELTPSLPIVGLKSDLQALGKSSRRSDFSPTSLDKIPIGQPLPGKTVYVLDAQLQPVPVGVPAELYIGGNGLARGYWQRDDLTAERFIANPFGAGRLYRTGDLARWLQDGTLEFIGRVDHQVKIRGFRIELGEIETLLTQHPAIQAAAVMAREDTPGQKRLVAYWVNKPAQTLSAAELTAYLQGVLPAYMIPAVCVPLEVMPHTANGKINRKALPAPTVSADSSTDTYVAPTQPLQQQLADIWASVLGRTTVGIHDNFFELGGDSILSLQVVARARQQGLVFQPKQLFQYQTIAKLVNVVEQSDAAQPQAEQGLVTGRVELAPIQHWFFAQAFTAVHHHNLAFRAEAPATLQPELLEEALRQVSLHHDALRSRFSREGESWLQTCDATVAGNAFAVIDLAALSAEQQQARWLSERVRLQASLDMEAGELQRLALFRFGAQQPARLCWVIHHLVVDGVSWRVLLEDLQTAYQQLQQGQPVKLPAKTLSFQAWNRWLATLGLQQAHSELPYWQQVCATPTPALPLDFPANHAANTVASQAHVLKQLSVAATRTLLQEAHQAYHTQINDLLLTALLQTVAQQTGQNCLRFDMEGHGREQLDLSRTVGWFTSLYPVVLTLAGSDPATAIKSVKEQLRAIPNRGMGYGVLRYVGKVQGLEGQGADLCFNYLGQFDTADAAQDALLRHATLDMDSNPHSLQQHRPYALEINCLVQDGQLQVDWSYSTALHQPARVETLASAFMAALQALLTHCQDPQAGGYTSSDFAQAKLKQNQLDQLLNRIKVGKRK